MMNSKKRAELKGIAQNTPAILQYGKSGISPEFIKQVEDAIEARELIKITVLETAPESPKEFSEQILNYVKCEVVQVIGRKVVLYRKNEKKQVIVLKEK